MKPKNVAQTIRIDILPRFGDANGGKLASNMDNNASEGLFEHQDFQFLFQHAYDATLITDVAGHIIIANGRAEELLYCSQSSLREIGVQQIISGLDETLLKSIIIQLEKARFMRISAWCARFEGDPFPAEIAVSRMLQHENVRLIFYIRDESIRRRAENELRLVGNAIQNAGTGIAVADIEGRLIHINPALRQMWDIDNATATADLTIAKLLGEVTAAAIMQVVNEEATPTWIQELPIKLGAEEARWIQVSAAVNLDHDNMVTGVVLSFVDVSDRYRADAMERLHDRDRVMAQSLGAVCHHLGQPTTILLSSIEMMRSIDHSDTATLSSLLDISLEAAEEVRQILRKLNDIEYYKPAPYLNADGRGATTEIVALDESAT